MRQVLCAWVLCSVGLLSLQAGRAWGRLQIPADSAASTPSQPWERFLEELSVRLSEREYSTMAFLCLESNAPCLATEMLRALGAAGQTAVMLLQAPPSSFEVPLPNDPLSGKTGYVLTRLSHDSCVLVERLTNDSGRAAVILLAFEAEDLSKADGAFQTCWRHRFPNVIAVFVDPTLYSIPSGVHAGGVSIYTYDPFVSGTCNFPSRRFVRTWTSGSPLGSLSEVGLSRKVGNLNGCALRVTTVAIRPWTSFDWDKRRSQYVLGGSLQPLVATLSDRMNFTVNLSLPVGSISLGSGNTCPDCVGVYGDLFHNHSDMAVVMSYKRSVPTPYHVQILTSQTSCATWCLPTGYRSRSMTHLLLGEFSPRLWLVLILTFVASGFILWTLSRFGCRMPWGRAAMLTLRSLLGSSAPLRPNCSHSMRVFYLGWTFFSMIMGTLYGAVLRSYVVAQRDATVFRSLEDIQDANIPFYLPAERMHFFHDPPLSDTGSEGPIMRRALPFSWEDARPLLQQFVLGRNFSLFVERDTCLSMARYYTPRRSPAVFHVLRGHCGPLLRRSVSFVIVLRRSPLLPRLRTLLARLDEAGITAHWTRMPEAPATTRDNRVASPLSMMQVLPFLLVLAAGHLVATLAFLAELLGHRLLGVASFGKRKVS